MSPPGDLGVSDFGISAGGPSVARGEGGPPPEEVRFALAAALRRVTRAVVGLPLEDEPIVAATAAVEGVADTLEAVAGAGRRPRAQPDPAGHPQDFFPTSPVIGFANPVAPPVTVEAVDGALRGSAFFDYQYEGPPSCVHGGVLAMVFDELLGAANIVAGFPGMTGTLTVRYRSPTPLRTPLRLEARTVERQGRKVLTKATIHHDDVLTAEAEGIFIALAPDRFVQVVTQHSASAEVLAQVRADARRLGFSDDGEPRQATPGPDTTTPASSAGPDPDPAPGPRSGPRSTPENA